MCGKCRSRTSALNLQKLRHRGIAQVLSHSFFLNFKLHISKCRTQKCRNTSSHSDNKFLFFFSCGAKKVQYWAPRRHHFRPPLPEQSALFNRPAPPPTPHPPPSPPQTKGVSFTAEPPVKSWLPGKQSGELSRFSSSSSPPPALSLSLFLSVPIPEKLTPRTEAFFSSFQLTAARQSCLIQRRVSQASPNVFFLGNNLPPWS